MQFDKHGRELPDNTPLALPAGFTPPETLAEQIQRLVRTNVSQSAEKHDQETFEEADDFDIEDDEDFDASSPFEQHFDPVIGRDVTAHEIMNDPALKERYTAAQAQLDAEQTTEPEPEAAGGTKPTAPPVTSTSVDDPKPT